MKNTIILLVISLIGTPLFSQFCTSDFRFTELESFSISEIDTIVDIEYGAATNFMGSEDTLLLDAYFPRIGIDTMTERPAVLMIHGGGFSSGNKEQRRQECIALAQRGYVAFSISYRLGWNPAAPITQLLASYRAHQDANAALRYVVANRATFGLDTSWIFIGGSSAGAITALNVVYSDQTEWEAIVPGIEGLLGNLDSSTNALTEPFSIKGVFNNWGAVPFTSIQTAEMVPMISFHGDMDSTVLIDSATSGLLGSRSLHNKLTAEGVCSEITIEPGGGHGIYRSGSGAVFRASRTSCFFKSVFCGSCTDAYLTDSIPPTCSVVTSTFPASNLSEITVFPNPTTGQLNIQGLKGGERLSLYNTHGEMLFSGERLVEPILGNQPPGLYFLKVSDGTKELVHKVIRY